MNYKSRKITLLLFIMILFLITSFVVSASAPDISITDIWYKKLPNYTHLTIKASGEISEYEVFYLEEEGNPKKIVVDIKNAIFNIKGFQNNSLLLNMGSVHRVRFGQWKSGPIPITRIVVDLFQKANYEVKLSPDNRLLYIDVYDYTEFKAPEEQIFTVTPVKGEVEKIEKEEEPKISLIDAVTDSINLNFKETDVVDAVRALSEISGIDIVVDDSVTGKITLNLSDKSFREALDLILMLKGLDYTVKRDTLIIAKKEVIDKYKEPITKIFELKNARAEAAKGILDSYKTEGSKVNIIADTRTNTLIVIGRKEEIEKIEGIISTIDEELQTETFKIDNAIYEGEIGAIKKMLGIIIPDENRILVDDRQSEITVKGSREDLDNARKLIAGLDKPAPQVMIETKIIEINLSAEKELGIKWKTKGMDDLNLGEIILGELTMGGSFERLNLIEAKLKVLQSKGKANILANPKLLFLDGREEKIFSGQQIPKVVEKFVDGEVVRNIEYTDVGLQMIITPRIRSDNLINMDVHIEVKSINSAIAPIQGYPGLNNRSIDCNPRVRNNETIVIGGIINSEDIKRVKEIPLLADIPIIGELFRFTETTKEKSEIIILITAHLVDY